MISNHKHPDGKTCPICTIIEHERRKRLAEFAGTIGWGISF
ncbi:MAG TPA: hypothetical protein VFS97_09235 [Nitrososphaeraceae archaeon]|nr:hypothetical protein [Nitrososphaeraceae archaeon]